MTTKSNDQGRAYEYAWGAALRDAIAKIREVKLVQNSSLSANAKAWSAMSKEMKQTLNTSAKAAVDLILELEPLAIELDGDVLTLVFQQDSKGEGGDVRDLLLVRETIKWQVGLSIKHNHEAVKHSRISSSIDFGREWFEIPCSSQYWQEVSPIFEKLQESRSQGVKWREFPNKEKNVYVPLLIAFVNEIKRAYEKDKGLPRRMVEYLIGKYDYYKVISHDNDLMTVVRTFNIHRTLNKRSKIKISSITVPIVKLPSELIEIRVKPGSNTTVEMFLNEGWQLSFRIHSASTIVQPSLKFDIQFIGIPEGIQTFECKWSRQ